MHFFLPFLIKKFFILQYSWWMWQIGSNRSSILNLCCSFYYYYQNCLIAQMKWNNKFDDSKTKEKIELLLKEFDRFVTENHEGGLASEDKLVVKEWRNLKSVIEKDPTDIEGLQTYINSIQSEEKQENTLSKTSPSSIRSTTNLNKSRSKQNIPFELDKSKLKRSTRELMDAIQRNNRDVFRWEIK